MTMTGGTICNNSFGTTVYSHVAGGVVNCGTMTLSGDIEISGNYGGSNTSNICDIFWGTVHLVSILLKLARAA